MRYEELLIRVRAWSSTWFLPIAVGLLAIAVLSGWFVLGGDIGGIGSEGEFEHSATVQEDNPLFPTGMELTGRSVYFTQIAPELSGAYVYTHSDDAEYTAETDVILVSEATDEDGNQYWRVGQEVDSEQNTVGPGEEHRVPFDINVQTEAQRIAAIEETVLDEDDAPEETRLIIVMETTVSDEDGSTIETETDQLPIGLDGNTYEIEEEEEGTFDGELLAWLGAILVFLGSTSALLGISVARHRNTLEPRVDDPVTTYERQRKRFDGWISQGTLPEQHSSKPRVQVASLKDLVDVAIDTDRRVIQDESRGSYYVIDMMTLYTYDPPRGFENGDEEGTTVATNEGLKSNKENEPE